MSTSALVKATPAAPIFFDPSPAPSAGPGEQPLTLFNLLHGLRRRWRAALGVGILAGVICAALIWLFLPPAKPSAYAKIYFPAMSERMRYEQADPPLKEQTQKELILSRMILGKVVATPEVAELETIRERPDPVAWLSRELSIEIPTGAEIMKISLAGDRPEEMQTIVNAVKETYLAEIANEAESRRNERESRLLGGLAKAEKEYESAVESMRKRGEGVGSGDPQTIAFMNRRLQEQKDQADADLRILRDTLERNRKELVSLEKRLAGTIDVGDQAFDSIFQTDEEVILLAKHRKEVERKLNERKRLVAPDHPSIKDIQTDLNNIVHKIDDRRQELRPFLETRVRQKLTADAAKLRDDIREGEIKEQATLHRIAKFDGEAKALDSATLNAHGSHKDLLKLKAKVDDYELEVERLRNAREAPFRARTLEEAVIVRPNEAARKSRFAAGAFVGVFALTLVCFAFGEHRTRRIASPDEVEHGLGLPVMGTVPALPIPAQRLPVAGSPKSAELILWEHLVDESVDSTRTLFLHTADANDLHVVAVTSAVGGEGKTSLSCQLAKSVARSGRRVLLIDADLRNPSVHQVFDLGLQPGVSECLRSELPPPAAIRESGVPNLFVLAAGRCDTGAIGQLAMDGFRRILDAVRGQFDFVLIDSCPVLPVADALLIARCVDGVLLSFMCDVSQVERAQIASRKLASVGARVIGAVVHGTNPDSYGYGPRYLTPVQAS